MATWDLSYLSDLVPIKSVEWDIFRQEETFGNGKGQMWASNLAPPLWRAVIQLAPAKIQLHKEYAARIRNLAGARDTFLMNDPQSKYPKLDPDGTILGNSNVQIKAIDSNRQRIQLKGLPDGYRLYWGDKIQVLFGAGNAFSAFMEMADNEDADNSGETPYFRVTPYCPIGVAVNDEVILKKPACTMVIMPGTHKPGTAGELYIQDQQFVAIEKILVTP